MADGRIDYSSLRYNLSDVSLRDRLFSPSIDHLMRSGDLLPFESKKNIFKDEFLPFQYPS